MADITKEHKRRLAAQGAGQVDSFPVLSIKPGTLIPEGAFAEAQATYLNPDPATVEALDSLLREKNIGIVAHFYMGPELQGVLSACTWPHIFVADSLAMADAAIKMANAGVAAVIVLGVDFMSENVRAQMDALGCEHVPVFRVRSEEIGCSLAESADRPAYGKYMMEASKSPNAMHVVYINTGLLTKAKAHAVVPTITCTSSNVVRLILQAFHQIPDLKLFFGPDTYMGGNLETLFNTLAKMDDEAIQKVHPEHNKATIQNVCENFQYFKNGTCIVHHMFDESVAKIIKKEYPDAYVTAHLEVPGEMFGVALEAQHRGMGVVGATSNILDFICGKVDEMVASGQSGSASFILGTEAGMVTPIVRKVQAALEKHQQAGEPNIEVKIIFPVAQQAMAKSDDSDLKIIPGVASGEGCSAGGGCATCPYMKMNDLQSLTELCKQIGSVEPDSIARLHPRKYTQLVRKRTAAEVGGESIMHMRAYTREGKMPDELVEDVKTRSTKAGPPSDLKWVKDEGLDW